MAPQIPDDVRQMMARRDHRMHHYLWHAVRNAWEQLGDDDRQQVLQEFPGWNPPRSALDSSGAPQRDNNSGEDFLYMHRQMIAEVNRQLNNRPEYPKVVGWPQLPAPDDPDYPVPDFPGDITEKTLDYYNNSMKPWDEQYRSDTYLAGVTLGQLGSDIEFTIHNGMHTRFMSPSAVGYRPNLAVTQPVDTRWDDIAYDFLGDTYSSHVNSVFWKVHGWVDNRIEDWKRVHNVTGDISWVGTWVGGPMEPAMPMGMAPARPVFSLDSEPPSARHMERLEGLARIISKVPTRHGFFVEPEVLQKADEARRAAESNKG